MIVLMNSKSFFENYIEHEEMDVIQNANYVLASARIRVHEKRKNIINAHATLYPDTEVTRCMSLDDMKISYMKQLNLHASGLLAGIIKAVIEENINVVILNTKKEDKGMPYLKWLQEFMYYRFGYPSYFYDIYCEGGKLIKYDKEKVLKKVNKELKKFAKKRHRQLASTKKGREELVKQAKEKMSTKDLKKFLKKKGVYTKRLTRKEMLEIYGELL